MTLGYIIQTFIKEYNPGLDYDILGYMLESLVFIVQSWATESSIMEYNHRLQN